MFEHTFLKIEVINFNKYIFVVVEIMKQTYILSMKSKMIIIFICILFNS